MGCKSCGRARNGAQHFRDGRLLLDEFRDPILRLRSAAFSVDTLVHAEQFLSLDGEGSVTAPAAVRDSSHVGSGSNSDLGAYPSWVRSSPNNRHKATAAAFPFGAKMRHWVERCHNDAPMNICGKSATSALRCIGRLPIQQNIVHPDFHRNFHVRVRQNIEAPVLHRVDRDPCDVSGG